MTAFRLSHVFDMEAEKVAKSVYRSISVGILKLARDDRLIIRCVIYLSTALRLGEALSGPVPVMVEAGKACALTDYNHFLRNVSLFGRRSAEFVRVKDRRRRD
jgi:hypothetical protein